jgi:predicted phosphodiesterase
MDKNRILTIELEAFPAIIFTDTHTDILHIQKLQGLYPGNQMLCLGDITSMFSKGQNEGNIRSIQFFMDNRIPCLMGNHDSIVAFENSPDYYDVPAPQKEFLRNLPRGCRLVLPDKTNYLGYHNRPDDLWSFTEKQSLSKSEFLNTYPVLPETRGVLIGHQHTNFVRDYESILLIAVGSLCEDGYYVLLDKGGVAFMRL